MRKFIYFSILSIFVLYGQFSTHDHAFAQKISPDLVRIAILLEPPHLDPTSTAAEATAEVVLGNVFEGLTEINRKGEVKPLLAESWKISRDGRLYIFDLKKGVKFHNGVPFNADSVRFSLMRARAEESLNSRRDIFARIEEVNVINEHQVEVLLREPFGEFLFYLGTADAVMVSMTSAERNKQVPIGTGPYAFLKWVKGHHIELVANPGYWRGKPEIQKVVYRFINDASIQVAYLLSGDIDCVPNMSSPEVLPRLKKDPNFVIKYGSTEGETIMAMNNQRGPLQNKLVRQAISHAVNKMDIINAVYNGSAKPIGSHFSPNHPAYIDLSQQYAFDPEKAKSLLKEAGFEDGFTLTLRIPPLAYAQKSSEVIAYQLKQVGIKLLIESVDWSTWLERVYRQTDYDLTIVSHTEPLDINNYARPKYYYNHQNEDLKSLLKDLTKETSEAERFAMYKTAQKMIADDAINVFLFQLPKVGVWHKKLKGPWQNSPITKHPVFEMRWEY